MGAPILFSFRPIIKKLYWDTSESITKSNEITPWSLIYTCLLEIYCWGLPVDVVDSLNSMIGHFFGSVDLNFCAKSIGVIVKLLN